jgi:MYXO-CTERM domain-containing protein
MTGGRVFPLLVGLWASVALGQQTFTASATIPLDGGAFPARAYLIPLSGTEYVMANAGGPIQVFNTDGGELPLALELTGTFSSFAVLGGVGPSGAALVVASDVSAACTTFCLRTYFWDPSGGFAQPSPFIITTVLSATAMTIDGATSPIVIYYASAAASGNSLFAQQITINSSNQFVPGSVVSRSLALQGSEVLGMAADDPTALYLTDDGSVLYTFPLDLTNLDGGVFAVSGTPTGYTFLRGITLTSYGTGAFLLGGGDATHSVYLLQLSDAAVSGQLIILAQDGGPTIPSAASWDTGAMFMAVTEDAPPRLHLVSTAALPDAGGDGGTDAGTDAGTPDAGGIPTIPIIAPGPGALPGTTNSCNCSTAGSAPLLLVLLLPFLVSRRRR